MNQKAEQAMVGLFVIVAAVVLVGTVFAMSGAFGHSMKTFHSYYQFAGGLESGSSVRYSGGPKVGKVEQVRIDPQNPGRLEITFSVQADLPVKTDSKSRIMSLSPLGDNHLEIVPGSAQAGPAQDGATLASENYVDFNTLTAQINEMSPKAQQLLVSLNERAVDLKETISRVNELLSPQNRANLAATLANTRGMIEEDRPVIKSTLQRVSALTAKLDPLVDDFKQTSKQANKTLDHIDSMIGENRPDVRKAVIDLRRTLANMTQLTAHLDQVLDVNSENIDEVLDNLRQVTENLREFTAEIKSRPYSLIRSSSPPEHKPGDQR